jgi:hypothetical protein
MSLRRHFVLVLLVVSAAIAVALASAGPAAAKKNCGSFHVPGLLTRVHVTVTRGSVPCHRAKQVMKQLFNGHSTSPYKCVGPTDGICGLPSQSQPDQGPVWRHQILIAAVAAVAALGVLFASVAVGANASSSAGSAAAKSSYWRRCGDGYPHTTTST